MSNRVIVTKQHLTDIANAIREKTAKTEPLTLPKMANEIANISVGTNDFDKYIDGTLTEFTSYVETIRSQSLWWATFETANFPEAKRIESSAFWECHNMKNLYIPKVEFLGNSALYGPSMLTRLDLPNIKRIESYAFCFNYNLQTIVIGTTDCVLTGEDVFDSIQCTPTVYVPDEALETYKTATNWSYIIDYGFITLKGISELPQEQE